MVTLVGTQSDFTKVTTELIELEYEASEGYSAAINRVDNKVYKEKLTEFVEDHKRHIKALTKMVEERGIKAPDGPSGTQLLAIGKVALANIFGDKAILWAMVLLEKDTNTAYERVVKDENQWPEVKSILLDFLSDEKRHMAWLKAETS